MALGVPILKHFRVPVLQKIRDNRNLFKIFHTSPSKYVVTPHESCYDNKGSYTSGHLI